MWFGKFERGPFHLGRYSYWINLWADIWTAFAGVIFIFPEYRPVTDINVSIPFLVSAIVSANRNR
jgi:hypothetical protein